LYYPVSLACRIAVDHKKFWHIENSRSLLKQGVAANKRVLTVVIDIATFDVATNGINQQQATFLRLKERRHR
jgi:hypothetical protein